MKTRLVILVFSAVMAPSCDGPTTIYEDIGKYYPTVFHKLSPVELDSARARLNAKLGTFYLATLDDYGLLGSYGLHARGTSSITDTAEAISIVKNGYIRLSEFSRVYDASDLEVENLMRGQSTSLTDWSIIFANQRLEGMEVYGTRVHAILTDISLDLRSHHYDNYYIPPFNVVSKEEAREYWIGRDIEYICWGPSVYRITEESIDAGDIERCVYPLANLDSIVMHVAWKIPVRQSGHSRWFIFMDVITGKFIALEFYFVC